MKHVIRKMAELPFGVVACALFFLSVANSNATVPDAARHWFFRSATILNLFSEAFVVAWTVHKFRCGRRLGKGFGVFMSAALGLCLVGTSYEYLSSYGAVSRVSEDPDFSSVCVLANDALESVTKTSQNALTSVEMSSSRPKCARYRFSARGTGGTSWLGYGGQFDSDEIMWTIKRNDADSSGSPSTDIGNAYADFLAREPEIATYDKLKLSWNADSGRWEKSGCRTWKKD